MAKKKRFKFPWRMIISVVTLIFVGYVVYQNWDGFIETFNNLSNASIPVLILLLPEQLFMYYACGQIFFSYLEDKFRKNFSRREKLKISTELNFVNRAVPAGGIGGLAYLSYRLHKFGVSAGQASFLYVFRYAVTTVVNYLQALVAIVIILITVGIPPEAAWIIWIALLMNAGVFVVLSLVVFVASSKKRIDFFGRTVARLMDFVIRIITFGRKKHLISHEKIQNYFMSIHDCVIIVKKDKKSLVRPTMWGLIFSFCEVGAYWVVAISLGRPELLPMIMVGEAIGSVFDGIVPYGPYELGMAGVMGILLGGSEEAVAVSLIIVVMTRALSLILTIATGALPYNRAIRGREENGK